MVRRDRLSLLAIAKCLALSSGGDLAGKSKSIEPETTVLPAGAPEGRMRKPWSAPIVIVPTELRDTAKYYLPGSDVTAGPDHFGPS